MTISTCVPHVCEQCSNTCGKSVPALAATEKMQCNDQITEVADSRTGSRIGLEWAPPSDTGGSSIIAYTLVIVRENTDDVILYYGSTNSAVMNDLSPGNTYSYRVKATNAVGDGDWSAISSFLIAEAPSPPINLLMLAFDNTFVFFQWG